jgi:hypothetical protein
MLFLHAKNNMGRRPQGLAFRMEQRLLDGLTRSVSFISWESNPVTITANQALARAIGIRQPQRMMPSTSCAPCSPMAP